MKLGSTKKSRLDKIMRSKRFGTREMREIGRKEAGESRGFPILCMGILEDFFQTGKFGRNQCRKRKESSWRGKE